MHAFALKRLNFVQSLIIPQPGNSGDWNRYAYVLYNPANFNDPTGHYSGKYNTALEWVDDLGIDLRAQYMRENLPDYIPTDDEKLFRAYIALYMSKNVFIFNPFTHEYTSGYQMALYIAENGIRLEWSLEHSIESTYTNATYLEHCSFGAYACTTRGDPVIYFVFSTNEDRDRDPADIAGTLAHEMVHQMLDWSGNSVLEEYMAEYASVNVTGAIDSLPNPFSLDINDIMQPEFMLNVIADGLNKPVHRENYLSGKHPAWPRQMLYWWSFTFGGN